MQIKSVHMNLPFGFAVFESLYHLGSECKMIILPAVTIGVWIYGLNILTFLFMIYIKMNPEGKWENAGFDWIDCLKALVTSSKVCIPFWDE